MSVSKHSQGAQLIVAAIWALATILSNAGPNYMRVEHTIAYDVSFKNPAGEPLKLAELLRDKSVGANRDKRGTSVLERMEQGQVRPESSGIWAWSEMIPQKAGLCESGQTRDARPQAERV